jgi:uncharacterized surface protein with fasciclin (FAS1) repeats
MTNKTIVSLAVENPQFSTLVAAVKAAGLVETLSGTGPFTLFAPTNDAFKKLPAGTVENLLKPENKQQLVDLLSYHVVSGAVMSGDLEDGQSVKTLLSGKTLIVNLSDGAKINNAMVTKADLQAENGVVHCIDTVLMPE